METAEAGPRCSTIPDEEAIPCFHLVFHPVRQSIKSTCVPCIHSTVGIRDTHQLKASRHHDSRLTSAVMVLQKGLSDFLAVGVSQLPTQTERQSHAIVSSASSAAQAACNKKGGCKSHAVPCAAMQTLHHHIIAIKPFQDRP
ncbi:hypothetical protein QR685DRAFT_162808 [Neurospora intermedia]|uniref:Uncharacterized protein n=1 Tax=Neurospora intermedia TaxID=5142 RepID=A0ABR3DKA6_NEUIN